ncbi:Oidioi.mRNA.OKI2018_I69.PAR.g10110.t1.cds [Oikopleura dioica]|uniref:Oidioi.mRNA.OKI2018_I69.PAR.g10110.t1.cds n=1 Tax=Oikopleura dioica TaxID=34765 RepID=A0ABN7RP49_OIKDI|nr:Oidioi.mRNA.OKI2018_I69.PAR.g10110.t1.cds [Oikopleura dioica]
MRRALKLAIGIASFVGIFSVIFFPAYFVGREKTTTTVSPPLTTTTIETTTEESSGMMPEELNTFERNHGRVLGADF